MPVISAAAAICHSRPAVTHIETPSDMVGMTMVIVVCCMLIAALAYKSRG